MGVEWVLLATLFVGFAVGVYVGARGYRWRLLRNVRRVAPPPVPGVAEFGSIDHDQMFKVLEQWGKR